MMCNFMCPCLFSADNATRKNIRKKNTAISTSSYIFLCLQAPLVCLVVIKLRSVRGTARYPALDASHGCSSADAALGQEPSRRMGMWSKWLSDVICICAYCASECFRNPNNIKWHKPLSWIGPDSGYVLIPQSVASINSIITSARIRKKWYSIMQGRLKSHCKGPSSKRRWPVWLCNGKFYVHWVHKCQDTRQVMASRIHPLWGIQHQQLLDKVSPQLQPQPQPHSAAWQQFAQIKIESYAEWGTHRNTHTDYRRICSMYKNECTIVLTVFQSLHVWRCLLIIIRMAAMILCNFCNSYAITLAAKSRLWGNAILQPIPLHLCATDVFASASSGIPEQINERK